MSFETANAKYLHTSHHSYLVFQFSLSVAKVIMKLSGFFTTGKGDRISSKLLDRNGMFSYVHQIPKIIPCLEFSIEFQSNKLIYHDATEGVDMVDFEK